MVVSARVVLAEISSTDCSICETEARLELDIVNPISFSSARLSTSIIMLSLFFLSV